MGYKFDFEWGESWIVEEKDFDWDRDYWFRVLARHIVFYREKTARKNLITYVGIDMDGDYMGIVAVSDNYVHIILHEPEMQLCLRCDEL